MLKKTVFKGRDAAEVDLSQKKELYAQTDCVKRKRDLHKKTVCKERDICSNRLCQKKEMSAQVDCVSRRVHK